MLDHGVVEADLVQRFILIEEVLMVGEVDEFMGAVQHVAQAVGKDAAVPQCSPFLHTVLHRKFYFSSEAAASFRFL